MLIEAPAGLSAAAAGGAPAARCHLRFEPGKRLNGFALVGGEIGREDLIAR
jgi:hypothetical protein